MTSGVSEMFTAYTDYAIDLLVDLAAIFVLAYVLYFRRHRRADLLLAYVSLNIGIFVAMSLLSQVRVDIALGFGLFAILSIIRLRSTSVTQQEVAYYFVALVLGLVNGLDIADRWLVVGVNVLLIGTMFAVDTRSLRDRARRTDVHLDVIHGDDAALVADLERRLGGTVTHHEVNDIDYVNETMVVDVRYRAGTTPAEPVPAERELRVTLDVIHSDEAALVADLERRLGGRVARHEIRDVDYVRDTMEVKVWYRSWKPVAQPVVQPLAQPVSPQPVPPVAPAAGPRPHPSVRPQPGQPQSGRPQPGRPQPYPQPQQVPPPFAGRGLDEHTVKVK